MEEESCIVKSCSRLSHTLRVMMSIAKTCQAELIKKQIIV
jgi:hypothetical protein